MQVGDVIDDAIARELARRDPVRCRQRLDPRIRRTPFVELMAETFEKLDHAIHGGGPIGKRRVAIFAPPGAGKSSSVNAGVARMLGRDPALRVLTLSASETLAKRNSKEIQSLVTSERFPYEVTLTSESILDWSLNGNTTSVIARGKFGQVSGFRAEICVADDLQADIGSDLTRSSDFEWFKSVLSTRVEPLGVVLFIMTRWHDCDIAGMLQESEAADQWQFINVPAVCVDDEKDPLHRKVGESIDPERWPVEKYKAVKKEVGSRVWSSLYLGDPSPSGDGALFQREWLEHWYDVLPAYRYRKGGPTTDPVLTAQYCDSAWKDGAGNDRTAIATCVTDYRDIYVVDLWAGRARYVELKRVVKANFEKWNPEVLWTEEAASGYGLLEDLRHDSHIPIKGVKPGQESKQAKWESVAGWFESGRVKFPRNAPFMQDVFSEFLRAPYGKHDDCIDAICGCVSMLKKRIENEARGSGFFFGVLRDSGSKIWLGDGTVLQ